MSRHATEIQEPAPGLPADHVLNSGAVLFPGCFDQHGCPLIVFPADGQAKLCSELSKAEVVDFIKYFLRLHNKKKDKSSLVSVVADLQSAPPDAVLFITESLHLLELHKRTVHTVYIIQPKKKDVIKLLVKALAPPKSYSATFKKILLKEVTELSVYIDRSQLTASLGGYHIYCHQSWVAFVKEIDAFVQEFLSVVQQLPASIATLQALSRLPLPDTYEELREFCFANEAKFQRLQRELGLDELLRHCERVVEKLRYPEKEPCYLAMAGTALFTHTAFDMLQNYNRITTAVEKVELLWHQAFSRARIHLQVFQLREEALRITEQIESLLKDKLHPYSIEIAKDAVKASVLKSEFEASIYIPAMALVRCSEDVIHTWAETLLFSDSQTRETWVLDLERLKKKLHSAVEFPHQTLRVVSDFHHYYDKTNNWYNLLLQENFLLDLLSSVNRDDGLGWRQGGCGGPPPAWRQALSGFLRKNLPPDVAMLVELAHLSNVIPDTKLQQAGKQLSQRCLTLRKLLSSPEAVSVNDLQLALKWQYELLRSSHISQSQADLNTAQGTENNQSCPDSYCPSSAKPASGPAHNSKDVTQCHGSHSNVGRGKTGKEITHNQTFLTMSSSAAISGLVPLDGKPSSLSSFDSGFDGAGSNPLDPGGGREGWEGLPRLAGTRDSPRPATQQPQIHEENFSSVSDSGDNGEEFDFGSVGNSSTASIQIIPKVTVDSLNFEIKVKRSAMLPSNPWLGLPVDDLENMYTVTITQRPSAQHKTPTCYDPLEHHCNPNQPGGSQDQPVQMEPSTATQTRDWILKSESSFEDPGLNPISKVLSSTITNGGSDCATEEISTLLWDSHDLHNQSHDPIDRSMVENSLEDWDLREQEGLREVEEILERADGILEEEEKVLAQEAMLDILLGSEDEQNQWTMCESEDSPGEMSAGDLAEVGVLPSEESLIPAVSGSPNEGRSTDPVTDTAAPEDNGCNVKGVGGKSFTVSCSREHLLTELKEIRFLDKLIVEENLKIHDLRHREENPEEQPAGKISCDPPQRSTGKERDVFRLNLEKEKREVERMEKSLNKELERNHRPKRHGSRAGKVVKCSVMGQPRNKNTEDQELCDKLLSGSRNQCQEAQNSTSAAHNVTSQDTRATNGTISLDTTKEDPSEEPVLYVGIQYQNEAVMKCNQTALTGSVDEPTKTTMTPLQRTCDEEEVTEEVGIQPQGCLLEFGETISACKPEASLSLETGLDDESFDPGGESNAPPVPKPRKSSSLANCTAEEETPCFSEPSVTAVSVVDDAGLAQLEPQEVSPKPREPPDDVKTVIFSPHVKEHHNNNNNNLLPEDEASSKDCTESSEIPSEERENLSWVPAPDKPLHTDLHLSQVIQTLSTADLCPDLQSPHQAPPDLPTMCEQTEAVPDGRQCSKATRTCSIRIPVNQTQLEISARELTGFNTPIILDTGSGLMKAGFADQDLPTTIFPTVIGQPKYEEIMNGITERETYIGHEAQHMRGVLALRYPMKNGIIRNWDEMEKIWHHTFQQLRVNPEDHPVLLTEAAMNPLENRQRMVEVMFECFSVPLTYVAMQAVLALYAAGRSTGVVFDSGDGVSHSVPVFEGYSLPHAVQRFPLAGQDVTMHLKKLLQEQGVCMRTTAELEIVREIKETCCCVALNYDTELTHGGPSSREICYTMPDGQVISLSTERFRAPEILFKPELVGRDHYGMHESLFKSILSSDIDLRRGFLGNIVLSGGNTLLPGLPERLQSEIRGMVPSDLSECVRVMSPKDRDFSVWSGGAVLASLPSFTSTWISQEEYEEFGPQIVFRKCF